MTEILQGLGLVLRGEVVWWKGRAAGGPCAWGTFQRPANPVLRDVTEHIVIASKGRFDRAIPASRRDRRAAGDDHHLARRVPRGHDRPVGAHDGERHAGRPPCPVPCRAAAAPHRALHVRGRRGPRPLHGLGDHGGRRHPHRSALLGFETDPAYVARADERVALARRGGGEGGEPVVRLSGGGRRGADPGKEDDLDRALRERRQAREVAALLLDRSGFHDVRPDARLTPAVDVSFLARGTAGGEWAFLLSGGFTSAPSGLRRADALWRALGMATVAHAGRPEVPLVLLTTATPAPGSRGAAALAARPRRTRVRRRRAARPLRPRAPARLRRR